MTKAQANKKAVELWGEKAFATKDRAAWNYRYAVMGHNAYVVGRDRSRGYLGCGNSYEEAFANAEAKLATK